MTHGGPKGRLVEFNLADLFESVVDVVEERDRDRRRCSAPQLRRARCSGQPPGPPDARQWDRSGRLRRHPAVQRVRVPRDDAGLLQDQGGSGQRQLPLHRQPSCAISTPTPGWWGWSTIGGSPRRSDRRSTPWANDVSCSRSTTAPPTPRRPGPTTTRPTLATADAVARVRSPLGRRPVLRVHGWHHRHAEGGAVAPRGHLLRGHGRRGSAPPGRRDRASPSSSPGASFARASWPCRCRRSCTPAPTGWRSRPSSAVAPWSCCPGGGSTPTPPGGSSPTSGSPCSWSSATPWPARCSTRSSRARDAARPPDVSSLMAVGSGGAMLAPSTKARLARLLPGRDRGRRFRVVRDRTARRLTAAGRSLRRPPAAPRRAHRRVRRRSAAGRPRLRPGRDGWPGEGGCRSATAATPLARRPPS